MPTVQVYLSAEEYEKLLQVAKRRGKSVPQVIREMVAKGVGECM